MRLPAAAERRAPARDCWHAPMILIRRMFFLFVFVTWPASRDAYGADMARARGWLHANGYTHHFAAPGANDNILGAGFTWYTWRSENLATAWEAVVFQDSGR